MIYGDQAVFAIEYKEAERHYISSDGTKVLMGYGKLWMQGYFYGTNEDRLYLEGYFLGEVDDLLTAKPLDYDIDKLSADELFDLLYDSEDYPGYCFSGGTFTDDFLGYRFKRGDQVHIVWRIRTDQKLYFSDLIHYPKAVHYCIVDLAAISKAKAMLVAAYDLR